MKSRSGREKGKRKISVSTLLLALMFIAGLSLLLYPPLAQAWNRHNATRTVANYQTEVKEMDSSYLHQLWDQALRYNRILPGRTDVLNPDYEKSDEYQNLLKMDESGQMGVIEIPSIDVKLPIYHGTNADVLATGVGHLAGTSLPVGGTGSHAVLTGHRGLPSAELFTYLDKLDKGDLFVLRVLDQTLTYQVDQIEIVKPWQTESLAIDPNEDYVTLVTCTPYGINTERLLVRGKRVSNTLIPYSGNIPNEALRISPLICALILIIVMAAIVFGLLFTEQNRRNTSRKILKDSGFEEETDQDK